MTIDEVFDNLNEVSNFANKDLGQNYLINKKLANEIVDLFDIRKNDYILEVGSGFGPLSIFLINKEYKSLTLNDIDPRAISFLEQMIENKKRTYVINKSALKLDLTPYTKIISNVPYYITNDLLEHLFAKSNASKYVLMIQKEVFSRIVAKPNSEDYGPLSILVSLIGQCTKNMDVSAINFRPAPHVSSIVFSLDVSKEIKFDKYLFLQFLKRMFLHRRKTIYNNLSLYLMDKNKAKDALDKLNISILTRPEQIDPNQYLKIFQSII